jgi:hypothetical protein
LLAGLGNDLHALAVIINFTNEMVFNGDLPDRGAEAYALNQSLNADFFAGGGLQLHRLELRLR